MTLNPQVSTTRVRSTAVLLLVLAVALGVAAPLAAAPIGWQASGGWYTESEDFFLGAGARLGFGSVTVIPNAEWLFVDSGSSYTLNIDGTMSVIPLGVASGYLGAGLGWATVDPDVGDSSTETVVNLIAGAGFNAVVLKPFVQLKWVFVDGNDPLVFSIGARF